MAKDETEKPAADERTPSERMVARKAAEQQFWQAARSRKKKSATGRIVLIVGGLALGASIAAAATLYGPQLLSRPAPPSAVAATGQRVASAPTAAPQGPRPLTGPAQAIDGATLTVAGQTIKLQGVEAPPASLVCRTSAMEYRCGDVARRVLDSFAGGAPVACLPATAAAGSSGTVAVCRNHRGWDLAALQVEAGWAIIHGAEASSPYRAQQARAQANGAGLWPAFAKPEQWTRAAAR